MNVALLREAFLELRDAAGRWSSRPTRWRRSRRCASRSRSSTAAGSSSAGRCATSSARPAGGWSSSRSRATTGSRGWRACPARAILRPGIERTEIELDAGVEPEAVLAAADRGGRPGDATSRSPTRRSSRSSSTTSGGRADEELASGARRRTLAASARRPIAAGPREPAASSRASRRSRTRAIVARREYTELVRSRLFLVSTVVLACSRSSWRSCRSSSSSSSVARRPRVGVVASDDQLARDVRRDLDEHPQQRLRGREPAPYEISIAADDDRRPRRGRRQARCGRRRRAAAGRRARRSTSAAARPVGRRAIQLLNVGDARRRRPRLLVAATPSRASSRADVRRVRRHRRAEGRRRRRSDPSAFAGRLIVGAVFGVLIFITIVIYGMWVAAGVVAEKSSRVMELLVSAASPRQLVIGKALGIGLAGATQYVLVLVPAILRSCVEDRIATARARARPPGSRRRSGRCRRGCCSAFGVYYVLGFALYVADLRGGRVAREPARGPPDHRAAADPARDRRLHHGAAGADRRDHRVHPVRVATCRSGARS